jgi:predicted GIY-YIG superfamily endonuclease
MCDWIVYVIENKGYTYVGVSPDPVRRLRQHNGEICGGAKYTTSKGPGWKHVCLIGGFDDKIQSMQLEWAIKHVPPRSAGGLMNRLRKMVTALSRDRWTSKAPLAESVPLHIEWHQQHDFGEYVLPDHVTETFIQEAALHPSV